MRLTIIKKNGTVLKADAVLTTLAECPKTGKMTETKTVRYKRLPAKPRQIPVNP